MGARDVASAAVEDLGKRLEQELVGPLARCDAGAAGGERIVEVALSKVALMEGQLRSISEDLKMQLAQEGGTLLEALAMPTGSSMRLAASAEPAAAVAAAAREMITG